MQAFVLQLHEYEIYDYSVNCIGYLVNAAYFEIYQISMYLTSMNLHSILDKVHFFNGPKKVLCLMLFKKHNHSYYTCACQE